MKIVKSLFGASAGNSGPSGSSGPLGGEAIGGGNTKIITTKKDKTLILSVLVVLLCLVIASLFYKKIDKKYKLAQYLSIAGLAVVILFVVYKDNFGAAQVGDTRTNYTEGNANAGEVKLIINNTAGTLTYTNSANFKDPGTNKTIAAVGSAGSYQHGLYAPDFSITKFTVSGGISSTITSYTLDNCNLGYIVYDFKPTTFDAGSTGAKLQPGGVGGATPAIGAAAPHFVTNGYYDMLLCFGALNSCPGCKSVVGSSTSILNCDVDKDFDDSSTKFVGRTGNGTGDSREFSGGTTPTVSCPKCYGSSGTVSATYYNASRYPMYFLDKTGTVTVTELGSGGAVSQDDIDGLTDGKLAYYTKIGKVAAGKFIKLAPGKSIPYSSLYYNATSGMTGTVIINGVATTVKYQADYSICELVWPPNTSKVYNRYKGVFIQSISTGNSGVLTYKNIPLTS